MPPRSKQPKTEWHQCSSCDSTISSRDASFHAELCSPDEPLQLNTLNLSTVKHGFFCRKSFVGLLTVFGDVPDHLDKSTSDSLVFLHPSAMQLGGFSIGQPVIVDNCHILTAWPCTRLSQTSVGVSQNVLDNTLKLQPNVGVLVYTPTHPQIPATELCLSVSSSCQSGFIDSQAFQAYVASKLAEKCLTAGNHVTLTYYGCPCELQVSKITEFDSDVSRKDRTEEMRTLSVDDIGGLDKQFAVVRDMIRLCLDTPEVFRQQGLSVPHGVLLYGPPGTGKSMLAHAILAQSSDTHVVTLSGSEIWSKYYGESEARLVKFFKEARERAPSLMFIDELNAVCPRRDSSNNEVEKRVIACLVSQFDAMVASGDRVFVITASNKRDDIDPALRRPGRLDREVEIGVPSMKDRVDILSRQLRNVHHVLDDTEIASVAERAHGFVGADLSAVCKEAGLHVLKRTEQTSSPDGAVIRMEDLAFGLGAVQPSAMREVAIEIPQVLWEDIGGQADLKHKLRQAIEWPLKHPEAFKAPRNTTASWPSHGPELFSKWVGESERAVREVFRKARGAAPAIVFFDEIDALAGERGSGAGGGGDVSDRVLAQLLTEMDGVDALQDVTVVAATNRPDRIDKVGPLLRPGRLDRVVYVPLPDTQTRTEIFSIQFRKMPIAEDVSIEDLVGHTEKYSGAEVAAVCHEAALCALTEDLNIERIHSRHFQQAVTMVTPRITAEMIDFYDTYNKQTQLHVI
ncbi:hypothetical protein LSAT2_009118 [Lamellibrachia satsuma]|nr:hypothetical protein LSAT2_009118 [Lamellibrachia satsuma]